MYSLVSPWPPQRNGIADYAATLVGAGTSVARVFTEAAKPRASSPNVVFGRLRDFSNLGANENLLYHFGNNPDHAFQASLFLKMPGVVCLHDLSLHYLVEHIDANIPGFFEAQVIAQLGRDFGQKALKLWRDGYKSGLDYQLLPMLDWLETAPRIIVHSQTAAVSVRAQLPNTPIHVIPHFARVRDFRPSDYATRRLVARDELDLPQAAFVITVFGFVIRSKQYDSLFNAITKLPPMDRRRIIVVIAGSEDKSEFDLDAVIPETLLGVVRRIGYVTEEMIDLLFRASDVVPTLRYPSFGENSGAVSRALGAGCAVIVPDFGAYGEIPEGACIRLPYGPRPEGALRDAIAWSMCNPDGLMAVRVAAYEYARTTLDLHSCANAFEDLIYA